MKAITSLPSNYSQRAVLEPSKDPKFVVGAVVTSIVLLVTTGLLLVQFTNTFRPSALDGIRFRDMLSSTSAESSLHIPLVLIRGFAIALIAVLITHELAHGLFYWLFSGKRPKFGLRGLFPYAAAPNGVYFPRNQFIAVGIAPLLLLTPVGLLLMLTVPATLVPILLFFVVFNVAGAAGDLLMVMQLLSYSSDTLMEDNDTGIRVSGPAKNPGAGC